MTKPELRYTASVAFDILAEECGANPCDREAFIRYMIDEEAHPHEFRFCGALGFGGKCYLDARGFRVSCYREDETPDRLAKIQRANARLKSLLAQAALEYTPDDPYDDGK